ncbi:MAG: hypothetical protein AAF378_03160 [Cyanobacteria bacterium P01_A01_bin.84]
MGDKSNIDSFVSDNNQMTKPSKYWTLVTIDGRGERKLQKIAGAKTFFTDAFKDTSEDVTANFDTLTDVIIQTKLIELSHDNSSQTSLLAKRCLLCFISWQIEQVCLQLVRRFGEFHGFTHQDLLPYVLDDDGSLQPSNAYECVSREILQTFNPEKSNLSTWTSRKVRQNYDLNKFLLGQGLHLISDWAILNDTKPQQLPRILGEYHSLTTGEIETAQHLLIAYHTIYRTERLQQRTGKNKGRCNTPTTEQLEKMSKILEKELEGKKTSHFVKEKLLRQLQSLADKLREYRIYVRGGSFSTTSLDAQLYEDTTLLDNLSTTSSNSFSNNLNTEVDESQDFLESYRLQMSNCLEKALNEVTESRFKKLKKKDINKANSFLKALHLFHCQRLSMSEIAKQLGLRAQDTVTRLLKLKVFRADVARETLINLKTAVKEIAKNYSTPERLVNLENQINQVLDQQVNQVISQAESEAASIKSYVEISTFSEKLCKQLEKRK